MRINKYHFVIGIAALCSIIGLWYISLIFDDRKAVETLSYETESSTENFIYSEESTEEEIHEIKVYITGEVKKPGVYLAEEDDRICDIVDKAGGFTDKADIESVNMAVHVKDEMHIIIGNIDENIDKPENSMQNDEKYDLKDESDGLIDINTADAEELKTLNGIGDVLANNIIEYRENNGPFKKIEDIENVPRIGDKLFEKIKKYIKVS